MNSKVKKKNLVGAELEESINALIMMCDHRYSHSLIENEFNGVMRAILDLMNQHKYGVLYNIIRKNCF